MVRFTRARESLAWRDVLSVALTRARLHEIRWELTRALSAGLTPAT
jgi:hypothetical protein